MLRMVRDRARILGFRWTNRIVLLFFAFALVPLQSNAQTVATYDFEDGTAENWVSFFGASTPLASNAEAYTGSYSLLTSTSASGTGGPSISLSSVLLAGAQYTITGWVRLTSGETATSANFTMKRTDASCSGGACYDLIGNYTVAVNDSGWAQIGGTYTPATTESGLLLYAQLIGATTTQSFYLDDVVITEIGGTVHYLWAVKKDTFFPLVYFAIFTLLLGYRALNALRDRRARARARGSEGADAARRAAAS